jgi:hypothetical protein
MKITLLLCFVFIATTTFSQSADSLNTKKLTASGSFSINSNGVASVPAFTLGKPAFITSVSIAKRRFSYDPVLGYGLDLKPWFFDNWLHYKFVTRPIFEMRAGFNYSTYFSEYKLPDETILQGQRYFTFALEAVYTFKPKNSLQFAWWNDRGQEPGTIKGNFLSVTCERTEIEVAKKLLLSANAQVFYINYTGDNDGLFITAKVSAAVKNIPLLLYFHGIQAVTSNFEPFPGFKCNVGLAYVL